MPESFLTTPRFRLNEYTSDEARVQVWLNLLNAPGRGVLDARVLQIPLLESWEGVVNA